MPIYEYRCTKCGKDFEEIVCVNDPAPPCPACCCGATEKLMSKASFHTDGGSGHDAGHSHSHSGGCCGCSGGNCASCH